MQALQKGAQQVNKCVLMATPQGSPLAVTWQPVTLLRPCLRVAPPGQGQARAEETTPRSGENVHLFYYLSLVRTLPQYLQRETQLISLSE